MTNWSSPPLAICLPSSRIATAFTPSSCPWSVRVSIPVFASQMRQGVVRTSADDPLPVRRVRDTGGATDMLQVSSDHFARSGVEESDIPISTATLHEFPVGAVRQAQDQSRRSP